jgi:hypothetical protein
MRLFQDQRIVVFINFHYLFSLNVHKSYGTDIHVARMNLGCTVINFNDIILLPGMLKYAIEPHPSELR